MPNIVQIQDDLKSYSDEQLAGVLESPPGEIPQYLVLTEMNRRQTLRDAATAQGGQGPRTTIAEELTMQMSPYGAPSAGMAQEVPAGFPALANTSQTPAGGVPPGFANGGFVSDPNNPFAAIAQQLALSRQQQANAARDARNLALAQIGFGMAASGSPYFGQAVGEGGLAGLKSYQGMQSDIAGRDLDILQQHLALAQAQQQAALTGRRLDLAERELARPPASVREYEFFSDLSEDEQAEYLRLQGRRTGPDLKLFDDMAKIRQKVAEDLMKAPTEGQTSLWADRFGEARAKDAQTGTKVQTAKVQREFDVEVDRVAALRYPHRAQELGIFTQARKPFEQARGLNLTGKRADVGVAALSPTAQDEAAQKAKKSAVERQRARMEEIRKEQQIPWFERTKGLGAGMDGRN